MPTSRNAACTLQCGKTLWGCNRGHLRHFWV